MPHDDPDRVSRELAQDSLRRNDPTGWFERLYRKADAGETQVPWSRTEPNALLVEWATKNSPDGTGQTAIVVGFGTGEDSEYVASLGFETTAFEISETAVRSAQQRFPSTRVRYAQGDLLQPPARWIGAFDLVVECLTVQSLPRTMRDACFDGLRSLARRGGTLFVVATSIVESADLADGPPWPLTKSELDMLATADLVVRSIEHFPIPGDPEFGRWRAVYARPT
jgi:Thiopurine S-methyltransferase (TPMT)